MSNEDTFIRECTLECRKAYIQYLYDTSELFEEYASSNAYEKYISTLRNSYTKLGENFHSMMSKRTDKIRNISEGKEVSQKYSVRKITGSAKKNINDGSNLINKIAGDKIDPEAIEQFKMNAKVFGAKHGKNLVASSIALADIIKSENDIREMEKKFHKALDSAENLDTLEKRNKAKEVLSSMGNNLITAMRAVKISSNDFK